MSDETPKAIVALRVVRPYESEDQFLREEAFALTRTSLVLVGASSRPEGVILRFEVVLRGGAILLRGEGRVVGYGPTPLGEPGLTLKFTRLDPRSKALVDRAGMPRVVDAPKASETPPPVAPKPSDPLPMSSPGSDRKHSQARTDLPMSDQAPFSSGPLDGRATVPAMQAVRFPPEAPTATGEVTPAGSPPDEVSPVPPPPATSVALMSSRDAALERLRERLRGVDVANLLTTLAPTVRR